MMNFLSMRPTSPSRELPTVLSDEPVENRDSLKVLKNIDLDQIIKQEEADQELRKRLTRREEDFFERVRQENHLGRESIRTITAGKGTTHIYGLSYDGNLYRLKHQPERGPHLTGHGGYTWSYINVQGMQFRDISVTKEGKLFAVSLEGHLFRFNDTHNSMKSKMANDLRYKLIRICAIHNKSFVHTRLFALADDGTPLTRAYDVTTKAYRWEVLGNMKLKQIAANVRKFHKKGDIWGLTFQDHAVKFNPRLQMWILVDPLETLSDISVGRDKSVYAIRKSDNRLVRFDGEKFMPIESSDSTKKFKQFSSLCAGGEGNVLAIELGTGNIIRMYDKKHMAKGPL
jgi:hypothetical protein